MAQPDEEKIRTRAFRLWQEAGSPAGEMDRFWFAAEEELKREGLGEGQPPQDRLE